MLGAIIGDIAGSRYEFRNTYTKDIELIDDECRATDDSICIVGIAKPIIDTAEPEKLTSEDFAAGLHTMCNRFLTGHDPEVIPFGRSFLAWLRTPLKDAKPYGSGANGAIMRVSPVGDAGLVDLAETSASCTHNSGSAMKAAAMAATLIDMAWDGASKVELLRAAESDYVIPRSVDYIRQRQTFDVDCAVTLVQAVRCFIDSEDFEDAIRNAISIGGDSDTIAAVTGSFAEAFYKRIPAALEQRARTKMGDTISGVVDAFYGLYFDVSAVDGEYVLERRAKRFSIWDDDQFVQPAE